MFSSLRHLNALRAFEAAARNQSIVKAALELHVSHSVVSQHVRNLEEWLKVKLFERHGNRIELSKAGRQLKPEVAYGLQILDDACRNLLDFNTTGTVNISAEPAIASRWLRKKITEFCEQFPLIQCNLRSEWLAPLMSDQRVDVIIHFEERLQQVQAKKTELFPIDGFPSCSAELFDDLKREGYPEDFSGLPIIHDNGRHIWKNWFIEQKLESDSWTRGNVYSDLALAIDAAVDGEGIFLADEIICAKEIKSGSLRKLDNRTSRCTYYLIAVKDDVHENSAISTFKDWIVAEAQYEIQSLTKSGS